ncbi:hypothetical protein QC334_34205 [Streptomyces sp. DH18]|uniref:hypothetical protein n=1 Tax=Streptomyces sp. DH18 TaxID=3040126 RepID=UPI002441DFE6|nr:hypothetical protein [Streptomyces sp. DH18]MDG9687723.1 hypothetical protein [Streptomyces sp. DH18]
MTPTQVRETHRTPLSQALTGTCPDCQGNFETCRCTGVATLAPRAGTIGDNIRREDDQSGDDGRGYERDETDRAFQRLVKQLVVDGDDRAAAAGRQARRTLKDMNGKSLPPLLQMLTRTVTFAPSAPAAGAACTSCQGAGGKEIDTSSDGVSRQHWQSCQPCGGTGVAR